MKQDISQKMDESELKGPFDLLMRTAQAVQHKQYSIVQTVKVQHKCLCCSIFDFHCTVQFFCVVLVFDLHKYKTQNSKLQ